MKNKFQQAMASAWYWKLSTFRCLVFGSTASWAVFKAGTNGFDSLSDMTALQIWYLFGDMAAAFAVVLIAFLDTSISRLSPSDAAQLKSVQAQLNEVPAAIDSRDTKFLRKVQNEQKPATPTESPKI